MSRTTRNINFINERLDEISGLDGIVADKVEELAKQVDVLVDNILKNHSEASTFNYYGNNQIEEITNSEIAQNSITDMAARIITLHKATEIPIDECIEIYCDKVKKTVYIVNDNPNINKVLDSFKAFMDAMRGGEDATKV